MAKLIKTTPKIKSKYNNIPVIDDEFDIYGKVKMIAEANNRRMGDQIRVWVEAELPNCEHEKVAVTVETFPNATQLNSKETRKAWFCATCNRVYVNLPIYQDAIELREAVQA